jgi:hypothetical protein
MSAGGGSVGNDGLPVARSPWRRAAINDNLPMNWRRVGKATNVPQSDGGTIRSNNDCASRI